MDMILFSDDIKDTVFYYCGIFLRVINRLVISFEK